MDSQSVERLREWNSRPFEGGLDALAALADSAFSGAVEVGEIWIFLLNGRVVGVAGAALEDIGTRSGTVYEAPAEALPLLVAMRDISTEPRARYYTEDTSLADLDTTLQEGSFTGYVELSENVMSGDYYLVYYGGHRRAVAYIGNAERLETGDAAYERAVDEVGIYEVVDVDIEVRDVPTSSGPDGTDSTPDQPPSAGTDRQNEAGISADTSATTDSRDSVPGTPTDPGKEPSPSGERTDTAEGAESQSVDEGTEQSEPAPDPRGEDTQGGNDPVTDSSPKGATEAASDRTEPATVESVAGDQPEGAESVKPDEEPFEREAEWRNSTEIPTIEPEDGRDSTRPPAEETANEERMQNSVEAGFDPEILEREDRIDELTQRATDLQDQRDALREELESMEADRSRLRGENEQLQTSVDRLEERVADLEATIEELRGPSPDSAPTAAETETAEPLTPQAETAEPSGTAGESPPAAGLETALEPGEALFGTNLFVRYETKSEPTLEAVQDGDTDDVQVVRDNLRLEHHTEFDTEQTTVEGRPYREFLTESMPFRFVDWLVRTLFFEIRDTDSIDGLSALYDVIPAIDRAEINATISLADDDTADVPEEITFDIVCYDKRGNPLLVVALNESRDPVTDAAIEEFEANASAVAANYPDLAGAVAVTVSYFEPEALELAEEATRSGLLRRSSRLSWVTLSRKNGYHFCLVEDREGGFHLTKPEL